jgi:hypothetical protein
LQGITITLMLRSVGALIFGAISDRYGRKWVMVSTLVLFIVLELATGFTWTLSEFIAVRALYGVAMWVIHPRCRTEAGLLELMLRSRGGLYGPAAATALEDLPYDARGILSGLFQVIIQSRRDGWRNALRKEILSADTHHSKDMQLGNCSQQSFIELWCRPQFTVGGACTGNVDKKALSLDTLADLI